MIILIILCVVSAQKPPEKKPITKDKEWFDGVLKLMESGNHIAGKAAYHPDATILYNMVKVPIPKYIQSFTTYEYKNCKTQYVHTKGPRGAIARWNCDFRDKQTGDSFPLDVTDEYDFDPNDRIRTLNRKFHVSVVEKFRSWKKPEKEDL